MARLKDLKTQIDEGKTVTTGVYGSYCAISKETGHKRIYLSYYDNEYTRYNGFKALIKEWAWDEETEEDGRWEVEPPLTEEEEAIKAEFNAARDKLGLKAAYNLMGMQIADLKIKQMERDLFTCKDKVNRRVLAYHINYLRVLCKSLEESQVTA